MIDILTKYLVQHRSLNIPGLGTIFIEKVPASVDFADKKIYGPQYMFRFDKYFDTPDKDFFAYLSSQENIADYEAIQLYNQFAQEFRDRIKHEEKVELKEIGVFKKNISGDISFEQIHQPWELYDPVPAERVIYSNAEHGILVGDQEKTNFEMAELLNEEKEVIPAEKRRWPIYALILALIALVVLFISFYKNGFRWSSIGNQQRIDYVEPVKR